MAVPMIWAFCEPLPHLCLWRRHANATRPSLCGGRSHIPADVPIRRPHRVALVEELGVMEHLSPPAEGCLSLLQ